MDFPSPTKNTCFNEKLRTVRLARVDLSIMLLSASDSADFQNARNVLLKDHFRNVKNLRRHLPRNLQDLFWFTTSRFYEGPAQVS